MIEPLDKANIYENVDSNIYSSKVNQSV